MLKNPPKRTGDENLGIPSNTLSSCSLMLLASWNQSLRATVWTNRKKAITQHGHTACAGENHPTLKSRKHRYDRPAALEAQAFSLAIDRMSESSAIPPPG